jgi:hypothetical protein
MRIRFGRLVLLHYRIIDGVRGSWWMPVLARGKGPEDLPVTVTIGVATRCQLFCAPSC